MSEHAGKAVLRYLANQDPVGRNASAVLSYVSTLEARLETCKLVNSKTLTDLNAQLTTALARLEKAREVMEPFAEASRLFDTASAVFGSELRGDNYIPRTEFTHGQLRAARAWMEQNDE